MRVLLLNLSRGDVQTGLQAGNQTLYNHSLFLQAVHPGRMQPEGHGRNLHEHFPPSIHADDLLIEQNIVFKHHAVVMEVAVEPFSVLHLIPE